jgi:hypothetical protein
VTRAIIETAWEAPPKPQAVSRQKKDALFELCCRVALIAERSRQTEGASIAEDVLIERRKQLRYGLELVAAGSDAEGIELAYRHTGVELDPGTRLELATIRAGLLAIVAGEHPSRVFRRMTAFLGCEYFDKASEWLVGKLGRKRKKSQQSLLVPGDLPDLVRSLSLDPRSLERTMRQAGWDLSAAALAGCPQESVDLVAGFFGPIGAATFEDDASFLRSRLSGDDIGQAQADFMGVVKELEAGGELELGPEDEFASDPDFVHELTRAVMALDDRSLRDVFREGDSRILALAMQGLEPVAHERILGLLPSRYVRRLLDAVDDAAILPRREVLLAGKTLATAVLAQAALRKAARTEGIESFERIRDWIDGEAQP